MLVSLSNMKSFLGIADASQDDFLTNQLELISEVVEGYCGRKFSEQTYVQTFYLDEILESDTSLSKLALYHFPVSSITSIGEKDTESSTPRAISDFRFHKPTGTITKSFGRFFDSGKILEVTYVAGYSALPFSVVNVIYSLVQERYNKRINGIDLNFGSDVQRISIPGAVAIDYDYSLSGNERKSHYGQILGNHINVLDPYRSERSVFGGVRLAYVDS